MIKLWESIMKNDENLNAEEVANLVQQSLCAVGSAFQSLNTHHRKRFQGCLTKEFRSLADKQPNKSEPAQSPWLFGSNLERKSVDSEPIHIKIIIKIFPAPGPFLPQNQYQRHHQQKRGKPANTQTLSRPGNVQ